MTGQNRKWDYIKEDIGRYSDIFVKRQREIGILVKI